MRVTFDIDAYRKRADVAGVGFNMRTDAGGLAPHSHGPHAGPVHRIGKIPFELRHHGHKYRLHPLRIGQISNSPGTGYL